MFDGKRRRLLASLGVGLLLAGCGHSAIAPHIAQASGTDEAALLERARAYWAAMLANDLVKAWPYEEVSLDPNWTLQGYLKRNRVILKAAEVIGVAKREGDEAVLRVKLRYDLPQAFLKDHEQTIADPWVLRDGVWYHKHVRSGLFSNSNRERE